MAETREVNTDGGSLNLTPEEVARHAVVRKRNLVELEVEAREAAEAHRIATTSCDEY